MSKINWINRKVSYLGYVLLGIAINGFFGIFLQSENPGTPSWLWYLLAIIGIVIIALKTLKFDKQDRVKISLLDILYVFILVAFALIPMTAGLNFIIGSIIGVLILYFIIDHKFLRKI